MSSFIISKLEVWQTLLQVLQVLLDDCPQQIGQCPIHNLSLWMACSGEQQFSPKLAPQSLPKMAQKFGIPIKHNSSWHPMKPYNFPKEQINNVRGIINFMTWNEMCHFGKSIHNNKNRVSPPHRLRQSQNKIHRNIFLKFIRNRKGSVQTTGVCYKFCFITYNAFFYKFLNISMYPRQKIIIINAHLEYLEFLQCQNIR